MVDLRGFLRILESKSTEHCLWLEVAAMAPIAIDEALGISGKNAPLWSVTQKMAPLLGILADRFLTISTNF